MGRSGESQRQPPTADWLADAEMEDAQQVGKAQPSPRRQVIGLKPPPHVGAMLRGRLFLGVFDPQVSKPKLIKPVSALPTLRRTPCKS